MIAAAVPFAGLFASKATVLLVIIGALAGAAALYAGASSKDAVPPSVAVALVALCLWSAVTAAWAADAPAALTGALRLVGGLMIGVLLVIAAQSIPAQLRVWVTLAMVAGWSAALILVVVEVVFSGPIFAALYGAAFETFAATVGPFWLTTGVAVLVVLLGPVVVIIWRAWGWPAAATTFGILLALAYETRFLAGVAALLVAATAAAAMWIMGRRGAIILAIIAILFSLAMPFAVKELGEPAAAASRYEALPNAARHRIAIWSFVAHRIAERPFAGWGMNASKEMMGGKDQIVDSTGIQLGMALPLHPHNAALQMWLELGLPGAIIYCALLGALIAAAARMRAAPLVIGQIFAALTIANISYGMWQAWWIATLWFAAAMMGVALAPARPR